MLSRLLALSMRQPRGVSRAIAALTCEFTTGSSRCLSRFSTMAACSRSEAGPILALLCGNSVGDAALSELEGARLEPPRVEHDLRDPVVAGELANLRGALEDRLVAGED